MTAYMYIVKCADGTYYTGSTTNLTKRLAEHNSGKGANYASKRLPVELVYKEEYQRIADAFKKEKQVQNWSQSKKEALISKNLKSLHNLASCKNESHFSKKPMSEKGNAPEN